jgi:ABC-2 type transport system permease protein
MQRIGTLVQRELGAYFLSPVAYIVAAIFLFSTGLAFGLGTFASGAEPSLRTLLDPWMVIILVFVVPILTMRLIAEEVRTGTIETLMTAPVTEFEIIAGKYLGALVFYAILLACLLLYPITLSMYGSVDVKLLLCHYLGLLLLGGLYLSIGLFFSTCTRHQVVATLLSLALLTLMTFAFHGLAQLVQGWPRVVLQHLSVRAHFADFTRGLLEIKSLVFFLTTTVFFLFLSVKWLEMRRWR